MRGDAGIGKKAFHRYARAGAGLTDQDGLCVEFGRRDVSASRRGAKYLAVLMTPMDRRPPRTPPVRSG